MRASHTRIIAFSWIHETEQRIFFSTKKKSEQDIDSGFILIPMPTIMNPFWFIFPVASYSHTPFSSPYSLTSVWMNWTLCAMNECRRSDTNQWLKIGFVPIFVSLHVCEIACVCVLMDFSFSNDTEKKKLSMETKLKYRNIYRTNQIVLSSSCHTTTDSVRIPILFFCLSDVFTLNQVIISSHQKVMPPHTIFSLIISKRSSRGDEDVNEKNK